MRAWDEFLTLQEIELGIETVQKWLKSLKVLRFDACNLFLEAKDSFQALWFEEHIRQKVLSRLVNNNNKKIKVHLTVANANPKKAKKSNPPSRQSFNHHPQFILQFDDLDPYCTFDHFVKSEKNALTEKTFYNLMQNSSE